MKNVLKKVLEEIENMRNIMESTVAMDCFGKDCEHDDCTVCVCERAMEIVRSHMDEMNDDWIPCSERLPEVPEGIEDDCCPEFNVTIKVADKATTLKCAPDGTWFDDFGEVYNVIAWQPLPEPYRAADNKPDWKEHILNTFLAGH